MNLYEITLKTQSGFGTALKGDTIFGHFCWQAAYDSSLLNGGLERWVNRYEEQPFAIFSSAWPKFVTGKTSYAFKRPDLPYSLLFRERPKTDKKTRMSERKEELKKKWILVGEDLILSFEPEKFAKDSELRDMAKKELSAESKKLMQKVPDPKFLSEFMQPHNTINRLTLTTGEGMFAPFSECSSFYYLETELAVFVLIDEEATDIERVYKGLERTGQWGYGKNASTGLGRFGLGEWDEIRLPGSDALNACYTLAPSVPQIGVFSDYFFTPFVRFGKHGDKLAQSRNPFKNPVVMADEGAVFIPQNRNVFQKPFLGRAISNTSKVMPNSIFQGYSIYLPFRLEV